MFSWRQTVAVLLVVGSSLGGCGPERPLERQRPERPCAAPTATAAALRDLTEVYGIVGVAVELPGRGAAAWTGASGVADLRTGRPMTARRAGPHRQHHEDVHRNRGAATCRRGPGPAGRARRASTCLALCRATGDDGARMTVRDLLRHTSGLPDHVDGLDWDTFPDWRYRTFTPVPNWSKLALDQPHPEQPWTYSTTNSVLAGMLVEQVTGHDIGYEITHRVIRSARLHDTDRPGDSPYIRGLASAGLHRRRGHH